MSDADKPQDAPFDFDKLVQLVKLMETHGLTEVSLKRGDQKWTLRRGGDAGRPNGLRPGRRSAPLLGRNSGHRDRQSRTARNASARRHDHDQQSHSGHVLFRRHARRQPLCVDRVAPFLPKPSSASSRR